ncbi:hypothetical protein ACT8ZV_14170 [Nocardioides sp. MAHUQ-72]|uniref:hypothetical protein n=1 Tax=unclassified Nocardioides TaxID=2615069 RepID=UPI00360CEFD0
MSTLAWSILWAAVAGGIGGFTARVLPRGASKVTETAAPAEAGWFLSTLAGAIAGTLALLSTDEFAGYVFVGHGSDTNSLTLGVGDLLRAFGVGLVGLKWLVNYQDSKTLRMAVAEAAQQPPNVQAASAAASAQPREVLRAVRGL